MEDIAEQDYNTKENIQPEKPKKSKAQISGDHKVTFTVTIAKAFPTAEDEPKPNLKGLGGLKGRRRVYEAPKPQNYYHLEYKLLPDESETMKTDVVTYGVAAKIYMESDSKVLKTWKDGPKTWVAWTHRNSKVLIQLIAGCTICQGFMQPEKEKKTYSHTLTITKEVLLKIFNHTLELKIWDMKDKVSPRARFDRPKAFRLPAAGDEGEDGGVRALVMKQSTSYNSLQPKPSLLLPGDLEEKRFAKTAPGGLDRQSESKQSETSRAITAPSTFRSASLSETPTTVGHHSMVRVQVRVDEQQTPQFGRLAHLAGVTPPMTREAVRELETSRMSRIRADEGSSMKRRARLTPVDQGGSKAKKQSGARHPSKRDIAAAAAAHIRIHGTATVSIKMSLFFSGVKSTTNRLEKPSGNIEDLLLSVTLDDHLLSESQKRELNPMVVKVCSASSMPNTPMSFKELREKCKPVHIQYQFYKQPLHNSLGREHGREVYWQDVNVVLLGILDKEVLAEYLRGPLLQIEVHDRNRKIENKKPKPSLFGENPEDEMINNVALIAGRRTTHNPFKGSENTWNPYGIAKFDLSGLLLGQKMVQLRSAIHSCPVPDVNIGHENPDGPIVGRPGNVDGPEEIPMPSGNYLEAGSELKIKVDLAYPISATGDRLEDVTQTTNSPPECPYGRIIYMFEYSNAKFLRQIQSQITAVNAEALELDALPRHVIEAALSTYKLSDEQKKSKTLDIITGFQVLDGQYHVFVLEGIAKYGVNRLWENLHRPQEPDPVKFNVLYNSDMTFSCRLYAALDVDLCRVRLHEPLTVIVQNPLLYVRDLVPRACFDALSKLDKMLKVSKLREVTRGDLFPTAEMVISMSREFGVPLTAEDFGELESETNADEGRERRNLLGLEHVKTTRPWTPIQSHNYEYETMLKQRSAAAESSNRNFVGENIMKTRTSAIERPHTIAVNRTELHNQTAHNYSIQTLNSTELAREKLRQILAKEKERRFTYCAQYNSATVLPVDPEELKKDEQLDSVRNWRTANGFIYPGRKTTLESNLHPKKPNSARMDELQKPWKENILHSNILKPTIDREIFPWPYRDKDLNLTSRPPPFFDSEPIVSVHPAGDTKEQELRQSQEAEAQKWREKVVVDDIITRTHRCLTGTELQARGPRASNQLAKLKGLLKDPAKKFSFKHPEFLLEEIPSLSVVMNPSVDTLARETGNLNITVEDERKEKNCGFNPGPFEGEGWLLERNKIPILDPEHWKYERLKGHDFQVYFKEKEMLYRRPIDPLTSEDKDSHLFAVPEPCS